MICENSNRPHFHGLINPRNFSPFPKNPIIAGFFRQIGRAEELGSGVRNLYKYTNAYSAGGSPQLIESDIFKIIVPLDERLMLGDFLSTRDQATDHATGEATHTLEILTFCSQPRSSREIMDHLGIKHSEYFRLNFLRPLIASGKLLSTIPDKPTSPNQKYYTNPKDS